MSSDKQMKDSTTQKRASTSPKRSKTSTSGSAKEASSQTPGRTPELEALELLARMQEGDAIAYDVMMALKGMLTSEKKREVAFALAVFHRASLLSSLRRSRERANKVMSYL